MKKMHLVLMVLSFAVCVQAELIWQADFDTYTLTTPNGSGDYVNTLNEQNGWWNTDNSGQGEIISESGQNVVRIGSLRNYSSDACYTPVIQNEPTDGVLSIAFDFYRPGTGNYSDFIEILGNNQCGVVNLTFDRSSGHILVNKGFNRTYDVGSFTPGSDYSFIVYKDDVANTFSLKLNDTMVLENIAWESWANAGISYITIRGGGNTGAWVEPYNETNKSYFGDITVSSVPEPVTLSLLLAGMGIFCEKKISHIL
jgi:hypothetical protein